MTIVEFLLARIAEDEAAAQSATPGTLGAPLRADEATDRPGVVELLIDPARVLGECEAKRRIVELADEATGLDMQVDGEFRVGSRDEAAEPYCGDLILRALALPYASHPDYDPAWSADRTGA